MEWSMYLSKRRWSFMIIVMPTGSPAMAVSIRTTTAHTIVTVPRKKKGSRSLWSHLRLLQG